MTVVLLAHGSADPRHAVDIEALAVRLQRRLSRPVRAAYLDHCGPLITDVGLPTGPALVVPLLFAPGYHAQHDVPEAVDALRSRHAWEVAVSAPPLLTGAPGWVARVADQARHLQPGGRPVLVSAGSSDGRVVAGWEETQDRWGVAVRHLSGGGQRLDRADLTAGTVLVPALMARGHFWDRLVRLSRGTDAVLAEPLGCWPVLCEWLVELCRENGVAEQRPTGQARSALRSSRSTPTAPSRLSATRA